jgi:hypothetical protein
VNSFFGLSHTFFNLPHSQCFPGNFNAPSKVQIPPTDNKSPTTFLAKGDWLQGTMDIINEGLMSEDTENLRVSPMALVRCSRGGKTRSLRELGFKLKKERPEAAVIFVSFNHFSPLQEWEQVDPLGALCRRIAFAASSDQSESHQYNEFCQMDVKSDHILKWLANTPCVLLIDELNNISPRVDDAMKSLVSFLTQNFLTPRDRYFVFSSHLVETTRKWESYFSTISHSSRKVIVQPLPLAPSLIQIATAFNWWTISPTIVLYCGLIPAMLRMYRQEEMSVIKQHLPSSKRDAVIQLCIDSGLVNDSSVKWLLASFFSNIPSNESMPPLRPLMDFDSRNEVWIPFHLITVLREFARYTSPGLERIVRHIANLLDDALLHSKTRRGDGWEALFQSVLLIRLLSNSFHSGLCLLPLPLEEYKDCHISHNELLNGKNRLDQITSINSLVANIGTPLKFPAIAVYSPTNAKFVDYDLVLALFDKNQVRTLFGYQLKKGKVRPGDTIKQGVKNRTSPLLNRHFWIRGIPSQTTESRRDKWTLVNENDIKEFFGASGSSWIPSQWDQLQSEQDELVAKRISNVSLTE